MNIRSRGYFDFTFHDAETSAVDGARLKVKHYNTVTFGISGTSSSRTVAFKGVDANGDEKTIMCVKLSDFTTASSTTGTGAAEIWQVDVTGLEKFFTDLTAVAGGNVTIKGRVVE